MLLLAIVSIAVFVLMWKVLRARKKYKSAVDQLESLELTVSRQCRATFADQLQIIEVRDSGNTQVPLRPCSEFLAHVILPHGDSKRDQLLPPPRLNSAAANQVKTTSQSQSSQSLKENT